MANHFAGTLEKLIEIAEQRELNYYTRVDGEDYSRIKRLRNTRIEKHPLIVIECLTAQDFSAFLGFIFKLDSVWPVSICSGGHHHEGMSSNDDSVVLVASETDADMRMIGDFLWVTPGKRLGKIIEFLAGHQRVMPTGGCSTVAVGGLTHGGGWGMSYRKYGLTCDALEEVEIVLSNGDILRIDENGVVDGENNLNVDASELFRAIRGGGGGNFGVVTRFKFRTFKPGPIYTEFIYQWEKKHQKAAALAFVDLCRDAVPELNLYARMSPVEDLRPFETRNPPFIVGGRFHGDEDSAQKALNLFWDRKIPPSKIIKFKEKELGTPEDYLSAMLLGSNSGLLGDDGEPLPAQSYALNISARSKDFDEETCEGRFDPHKISSLIPLADADHEKVISAVDALMRTTRDQDRVATYISFHGMGGAGQENAQDVAYPWRDNPYMLQAQVWWLEEDKRKDGDKLMAWIKKFHEKLGPYSEGAFINFPDEDQDVEFYYGQDGANYQRLQAVKIAADPRGMFDFKLGIKRT